MRKKEMFAVIICIIVIVIAYGIMVSLTIKIDRERTIAINERDEAVLEAAEMRNENPQENIIRISLRDDVDSRVHQAVLDAGIQEGMSQSESFELIIKWICDNTKYDKDLEHRNWEDIFECGETVCNGYAEMVWLMCNACGINCYKVHGISSEGEFHAWNYILLDGVWYWSDITNYDVYHKFKKARSLWENYVPKNFYHNIEEFRKQG